jgi:hypothetical protein
MAYKDAVLRTRISKVYFANALAAVFLVRQITSAFSHRRLQNVGPATFRKITS